MIQAFDAWIGFMYRYLSFSMNVGTHYYFRTDMKANNYEVVEAGEVITFQGLVKRSASQAYFLVFCTLLGMASLALVLQIQFQDLGEWHRELIFVA